MKAMSVMSSSSNALSIYKMFSCACAENSRTRAAQKSMKCPVISAHTCGRDAIGRGEGGGVSI